MAITREDVEYNGTEILRWDDTNETAKIFVEEFFKTPVGKQILANSLKTKANMELILSTAQSRTGHADVSLKEFEVATKQLFLAGDLQPKREPEAQAPAPKQLSASQQAWSEFRQYTNTHSVAECKNRARVDEAYRKFLHTNLQREMNDTPVPDAVVAIGTQAVRQDKTVRINEDLRAFAIAYRTMSSAEVRKNSNILTNPNATEWNRKVDLAIAAGLL
jgi:hypothetical protein